MPLSPKSEREFYDAAAVAAGAAGACVLGVGTDIADVARIRKLLEKYPEAFAAKNFTPLEIEYCLSKADPAVHFAARFAAKEAMVKALGTGFSKGITTLSVSLDNNSSGAPLAVLDAAASAGMRSIGGVKMSVSITHLKDYAAAFAVVSK